MSSNTHNSLTVNRSYQSDNNLIHNAKILSICIKMRQIKISNVGYNGKRKTREPFEKP